MARPAKRPAEIAADLRVRLAHGEFDTTAKLPIIANLTRHYRAATVTVIAATDMLIDEGLLWRHKGTVWVIGKEEKWQVR